MNEMQADRVFGGNTNSNLYMWEAGSPTEEQEFESDLIASTNEVTYSNLDVENTQTLKTK